MRSSPRVSCFIVTNDLHDSDLTRAFTNEINKNNIVQLCLEEGEAVAMESLRRVEQLLNRRQIDMSKPRTTANVTSQAQARGTVTPQGVRKPPSKRSRSSEAKSTTSAGGNPGGQATTSKSSSASTKRTHAGTTTSDRATETSGAAHDRNQTLPESNPISAFAGIATETLGDTNAVDDRQRRLARTAAYNNRAILLIADGRGAEACRLLRSCLTLLPGEERPSFNLTLALWRLGRPRAACAHWLEARGWLRRSWTGVGGKEEAGNVEAHERLLESARQRRVSEELGSRVRFLSLFFMLCLLPYYFFLPASTALLPAPALLFLFGAAVVSDCGGSSPRVILR